MRSSSGIGFTLAELLIALAILGVIAMFTIPKVLQSQASGRDKAVAKEVAGMISEAYQAYKRQNTPTAAFAGSMLTPYMNYVRRDTVITVDYMPNWLAPTFDCSVAGAVCLLMHNGGMLMTTSGSSFTGTTNLHTIHLCIDPDAKVTGAADDTGKAVCFMLYYDGRLTTRGDALPNSCTTAFCPFQPDATLDPSWFSWN